MWGFQLKRSALHEQLVLHAPEINPSEFVRRYLTHKSADGSFRASGLTHPSRYEVNRDGTRTQKAPA